MRRLILLALALVLIPASEAVAADSPIELRVEGGRNFGAEPVGSTTSRTVVATNTTDTAVSVGGQGVGSEGAFGLDFDSITCGNSLAAGASCSYAVLFKPFAKGMHTGYTRFASNNMDTVLKLRGRGI